MMTGENMKKATPKKKKIASLDKRKARAGWFFVAPFLIGFILLYLPIVVESIIYSESSRSLRFRVSRPAWRCWGITTSATPNR